MFIGFSWKSLAAFFRSSKNKSNVVVYVALFWPLLLLLDLDFLENSEENVKRLLLLPVDVAAVVSTGLSSSVVGVVVPVFTLLVAAVAFGSILLFFLEDFSSDQNAHDHALFRLWLDEAVDVETDLAMTTGAGGEGEASDGSSSSLVAMHKSRTSSFSATGESIGEGSSMSATDPP